MKILVTGGAGFIGSHVVDAYLAAGHDVVVVDDLSTGRASNLNPMATFYQLDIRSPELEQIFYRERPKVVNHHAAQMDVRRSVREPIFDADVNIVGSLNLLECARRTGLKRFIYISTGGAVYGEPKYLPCDEAHPIDPICQYGASKHTVEHYLYMYRQNYGLDYVVLRYPNVYGPRQDRHGEAGVVAIFTGQMLAGMPVVINGDGEQERDFVYVGDCARANLLALSAGEGIYNLGSGRGTSVNEIFTALREITGYSKDASHGPAKLGETRRIYLDAARARDELGWEPQNSLARGLTETVRYMTQEDGLRPVRLVAGEPTSVDGDGVQLAERLQHVAERPLEELLATALKVTGAQSGSAYLIDELGDVGPAAIVYHGEARNGDGASKSLIGPHTSGLAAWVREHRRAALVRRTDEDVRWLPGPLSDGDQRSVICVPLMAGRGYGGALTLSRRGVDAFSPDDLAMALTIAGMYSLTGQPFEALNAPLPIAAAENRVEATP